MRDCGHLLNELRNRRSARVDRGTRTIQGVTGLARTAARQLLDRAGGHVKAALVMPAEGIDRPATAHLLTQHQGHVAPILTGQKPRRHGVSSEVRVMNSEF